jgi:hypothetical protein
MSASHARISCFHRPDRLANRFIYKIRWWQHPASFRRPYVVERMQNGGSVSTAFDRACTLCVEEVSPQPDKVEPEQAVKSLNAGHPLEGKLAKIRPY